MVRMLMTAGLLAAVAGAATGAELKLTGENTTITFVGTKPDGKHEGGFKKLTGKATADGTDVTTLKIAVEIDMASLYSDNGMLTGHLKNKDFFEVTRFPKAKFETTKIEKDGDSYKVSGKLTLKGKSVDVTFPAKLGATADGVTLSSKFKIDRNDWGITYGKGKIDDEVTLAIEVKAKK